MEDESVSGGGIKDKDGERDAGSVAGSLELWLRKAIVLNALMSVLAAYVTIIDSSSMTQR